MNHLALRHEPAEQQSQDLQSQITVSDRMGAQEIMRLSRAILLYETAGGHQALATVHSVHVPKGGTPEIRPGQCLTQAALDELLRSMAGMPGRRQILPSGMLTYGGGRMAWWTPPQHRPIFFKTSDKQFTKEVGGRTVLHPPLLFIAEPGHLYVFALAEAKRPSADTALCQAPYFNIYLRGLMCQGNIPLPLVIQPEDIPQWEKAFFETNFTHSNVGGNLLVKKPHTHEAFWRMLTAPPEDHLTEEEKMLPELASYIISNRLDVNWADYLAPLDLTVDQVINMGETE